MQSRSFVRMATDEEIEWASKYFAIVGGRSKEVLKEHRAYCLNEWKEGRKPFPFTAWYRMSKESKKSMNTSREIGVLKED